MLQLLRRLLGRPPKTQLPPFDFARNRFKPKKTWPPQLSELTEKQQFRFERKFKRRMLIKSTRPQWVKWTKIVQWSLISFVVVYGVFFHDFAKDPMNPRPGEQPFVRLREWMWELYGGFWTHTRNRDRRRSPSAEERDAGEGTERAEGADGTQGAEGPGIRQHIKRSGLNGG
jgi:hypothetical protein